jgi:hypothetical protein
MREAPCTGCEGHWRPGWEKASPEAQRLSVSIASCSESDQGAAHTYRVLKSILVNSHWEDSQATCGATITSVIASASEIYSRHTRTNGTLPAHLGPFLTALTTSHQASNTPRANGDADTISSRWQRDLINFQVTRRRGSLSCSGYQAQSALEVCHYGLLPVAFQPLHSAHLYLLLRVGCNVGSECGE